MAKNGFDMKANGVWMGLRRCGCPVAVACDYGEDAPKALRTAVNKSKRDFLRDGLSVVYATFDDWREIHSKKFMRDCEHEKSPESPQSAAAVDPHVGTSNG